MDVDSITPLCLLTDSISMAGSVKAQLRINNWYTMQMSTTPNTRLCIHKYMYPFYRPYCRLVVGGYLLPLPVCEVTGKQVSRYQAALMLIALRKYLIYYPTYKLVCYSNKHEQKLSQGTEEWNYSCVPCWAAFLFYEKAAKLCL